jgi:hypothetical protein
MATLADEMQAQAAAILDDLMQRAATQLRGTLYEEMNKQKVLRARYSNVLDVLTDYAANGDLAAFRQHHILIFMQRYYLDIDAENPLTARLIGWRTREIERSVDLYLHVLRDHTSPDHHAQLDAIFASARQLIEEMGAFLLRHLGTLRARVPRVKLAGIEYGPDSRFDIDPQTWPDDPTA